MFDTQPAPEFIIHTKPGCSFCDKAKALLKEEGRTFKEEVFDTPDKIEAFKKAGFKTFPQVYHQGTLIGGYERLADYLSF